MKRRCSNANHSTFKYYGRRGISVCGKWLSSFESFLADVGRIPVAGYTLGRIDNEGNYEPGNVEWQSPTEQRRNTRRIKLTIEKASEIRNLRSQGFKTKVLANRYSVSVDTIRKVINDKYWK
jgi:hypothetical protein